MMTAGPSALFKNRQFFSSGDVPTLLSIFMVLLAQTGNADDSHNLSPARTAAAGKHLFSFSDNFDRPNSDHIGGNWVDCHNDNPANFEPLGIRDGGIVVADPKTRPGMYYPTPPRAPTAPAGAQPSTDKRLYTGIGCAWMETGATRVSVKILWSGNYGVDHPPPVSHVEATPLLYVSPDNPRYGFGAWTSQLWSRPIFYVGYIGSPPEKFEVIAAGLFPKPHSSGTPREVELRAEQPGKVTVWIDGEQVSLGEHGLKPLEVDPTMIRSTLHGFAVDAHFVEPVSSTPGIKAIESIQINGLE